jgi:hypothetical protein
VRKALPAGLNIDPGGGLTEKVTPRAGPALLVDLVRRSRVPDAAERYLPAKRSAKDLASLRRDHGLAALLAYVPSAPATARQWLDSLHEQAGLPS